LNVDLDSSESQEQLFKEQNNLTKDKIAAYESDSRSCGKKMSNSSWKSETPSGPV
jgi:hypothetical protein